MRRIVLLLLCLILLMSSAVSAAPNKWSDSNYDFTTVKTVLIMKPKIAKDVKDQFALQKIEEMLSAEIQIVKITPVFFDDFLQQLTKELNIDLKALNRQDPQQCLTIVKENAPKYVNAILYFDVYEMGWTKEYVQPSSYTYTKNETAYIKNSDGSSTKVEYPTQKTATTPGGLRDFSSASFNASLFDAKEDAMIWGYAEAKKLEKGFHTSSLPEKSMKKIIENAFVDMPLPKVTGK